MVPAQLTEEVEALKKEGHSVELIEAEGWANMVFHNYPVPHGYNHETTELLLRFPLSYPNGRPDMFWTDEDLKLKDGRIPRSADSIETPLGKRWRRFSWHPQNWNPGADNLRTYMEFVDSGLAKARN
jgi:hypothetical protein